MKLGVNEACPGVRLDEWEDDGSDTFDRLWQASATGLAHLGRGVANPLYSTHTDVGRPQIRIDQASMIRLAHEIPDLQLYVP